MFLNLILYQICVKLDQVTFFSFNIHDKKCNIIDESRDCFISLTVNIRLGLDMHIYVKDNILTHFPDVVSRCSHMIILIGPTNVVKTSTMQDWLGINDSTVNWLLSTHPKCFLFLFQSFSSALLMHPQPSLQICSHKSVYGRRW